LRSPNRTAAQKLLAAKEADVHKYKHGHKHKHGHEHDRTELHLMTDIEGYYTREREHK